MAARPITSRSKPGPHGLGRREGLTADPLPPQRPARSVVTPVLLPAVCICIARNRVGRRTVESLQLVRFLHFMKKASVFIEHSRLEV